MMIIMMIQLCVAKTCSFNMMFCLFISDSSLKIATEDVRKSFNMMSLSFDVNLVSSYDDLLQISSGGVRQPRERQNSKL